MEKQVRNLPAERHEKIVAWLEEERFLSILDLQNRLNVSHMTAHRDLDILAEKDLVRKVRGGAMYAGGQANLSSPSKNCAMCNSSVSARTEVVILKQDGTRSHACCPHCGIMMLMDGTEIESSLARDFIYGRMVNILQAAYIVGSDVRLCCVPSTLCFASIGDAKRFQNGFAGQLLNFTEAMQYLSETHHHH